MKFFTLEMADITAGHLTDVAVELALEDAKKQCVKNGFQTLDRATVDIFMLKKHDLL